MANLAGRDRSEILRNGINIRPIRGFTPTDEQAIRMAASVMSSLLEGVDPIPNIGLMPTEIMGGQVTIDWSTGTADDNLFQITAGDVTMIHDADEILDFDSQIIDAAVIDDSEAVQLAKSGLTIGLESNTSLSEVTTDITLPTSGLYGTTVSWDTSAHSSITEAGVVSRPANGNGDDSATLVATISKNAASDTKSFDVTVLESELTEAQMVADDKEALEIGLVDPLESYSRVINDMTFPTTGTVYGSTITWDASGHPNVTDTGVVTRPAADDPDVTGTIVATITNGSTTDTKSFEVTVLDQGESLGLEVLSVQTQTNIADNQDLDFIGTTADHDRGIDASGDYVILSNNEYGSNYQGAIRIKQVQGTSLVDVFTDIGDSDYAELGKGGIGSVAIEGDWAAAGISSQTSATNGVRLYKNTSGNWAYHSTIDGSDSGHSSTPFNTNLFKVSMDNNWLLIGAPWADYEGYSTRGVAFIYENVSGTWTYRQTIEGPPENNAYFSRGVEVYGDYMMVSCSQSSGLGYVNVYQNQSGTWTEIQRIDESFLRASGIGDDLVATTISHHFTIGNGFALIKVGPTADAGYSYIVVKLEGTDVSIEFREVDDDFDTPAENFVQIDACGDIAAIGLFRYRDETPVTGLGGVGIIRNIDGVVYGDFAFEDPTTTNPSIYDQAGSLVALTNDYLFMTRTGNSSIITVPTDSIFYTPTSYKYDYANVTLSIDGESSSGDYLGFDVDIDGDWAVAAAKNDDDGGADAGALYIYNQQGTNNWVQTQKIVGDDAASELGRAVAIDSTNGWLLATDSNPHSVKFYQLSGGTWTYSQSVDYQSGWIKIGLNDDGSADEVVIDGEWAATNARNSASPYEYGVEIYRNVGGTWSYSQTITHTDFAKDEVFGQGLAISGNWLVIGAPVDQDAFVRSGAFYLYENQSGTWVLSDVYYHTKPYQYFGRDLAMSEDFIIARGYGFDTSRDVLVFRNNSGTIELIRTIKNDTTSGFGNEIDIDGPIIAIAEKSFDYTVSSTKTIEDLGRIHLYHIYNEKLIVDRTNIYNVDFDAGDKFGTNIAVSGDNVIVGSPFSNQGASNDGHVAFINIPTGELTIPITGVMLLAEYERDLDINSTYPVTNKVSAISLPTNTTSPSSNFTYSSENIGVATIDANRTVTPVSTGTVNITAETNDTINATGSIQLTVNDTQQIQTTWENGSRVSRFASTDYYFGNTYTAKEIAIDSGNVYVSRMYGDPSGVDIYRKTSGNWTLDETVTPASNGTSTKFIDVYNDTYMVMSSADVSYIHIFENQSGTWTEVEEINFAVDLSSSTTIDSNSDVQAVTINNDYLVATFNSDGVGIWKRSGTSWSVFQIIDDVTSFFGTTAIPQIFDAIIFEDNSIVITSVMYEDGIWDRGFLLELNTGETAFELVKTHKGQAITRGMTAPTRENPYFHFRMGQGYEVYDNKLNLIATIPRDDFTGNDLHSQFSSTYAGGFTPWVAIASNASSSHVYPKDSMWFVMYNTSTQKYDKIKYWPTFNRPSGIDPANCYNFSHFTKDVMVVTEYRNSSGTTSPGEYQFWIHDIDPIYLSNFSIIASKQPDLNGPIFSKISVDTFSPNDATYPYVDFSSSDDAIAKVTQFGELTPVSAGTVTITATPIDGTAPETIQVTVNSTTGWNNNMDGWGIPSIAQAQREYGIANIATNGSEIVVGENYYYNSYRGGLVSYTETDSEITLDQSLEPTAPSSWSEFGGVVEINGDWMIASGNDAVVIYFHDGTEWIEQQAITGSGTWWGDTLAIDSTGTYCVIGDSYFEGAAGIRTGVVYIYENQSGTWNLIQTIEGDLEDKRFGHSAAFSGSHLAIGTGAMASLITNSVYIYENQSGTWTEIQRIDQENSNSYFGHAVKMDGNYMVVGAYGYSGTNGNQTGAVYVFENQSGTWTQVQRIDGENNYDKLGKRYCVDIDGDYIVAGANEYDSTPGTSHGAVYIFENQSGTWTQVAKFVGDSLDQLGSSVSIGGNYVMSGRASNKPVKVWRRLTA